MFQINASEPNSDGWVFISCNDIWEPDEFVVLVKEYQTQISGKKIKTVGVDQYRIKNDPHKLIFQYDDLFGIVVIIPKKTNRVKAFETLQKLCKTVNEKLACCGTE